MQNSEVRRDRSANGSSGHYTSEEPAAVRSAPPSPPVGAAGPTLKYSIGEAMNDRLRGITQGLQRRDRYMDVVHAYHVDLELSYAPMEAAAEARIQSMHRSASDARRALDQAAAAKHQTIDEEIEATRIELAGVREDFSKRRSGTARLESAQKHFDAWKQATGRLPRSEEFDALSSKSELRQASRVMIGSGGIQPQSEKENVPARKNIVRRAIDYTVRHFPSVAVPGEILFAYPSFLLLFGNQPVPAVAISVVFTLALVILGEGIGAYAGRVMPGRIEPLAPATQHKQWQLRRSLSVMGTAAFLALFALAVYACAVSASLRSLVPSYYDLNERQAALLSKTVSLRTSASVFPSPEEEADLRRRRNEIDTEFAKLRGERKEQLLDPFKFLHSTDGHVAFVVYLILVFSAAMQRRLAVDPIPAYDDAVKDYVRERVLWAHDMLNLNKAIESTSAKLNRLTRDKLHLSAGNPGEIAEIKSYLDRIEASSRSIAEEQANARALALSKHLIIAARLRLFAAYYCMFRFGMSDTALRSIRAQLATQPNTYQSQARQTLS